MAGGNWEQIIIQTGGTACSDAVRCKHVLGVSGDPEGLPWNGEWKVVGDVPGETTTPQFVICEMGMWEVELISWGTDEGQMR